MKTIDIPLALIDVDPKWNHRSGDLTADTSVDEDPQYEDLVRSLKEHGKGYNEPYRQLEPVRVRVKGKRYELIVGFRRHAAIKHIAENLRLEAATIAAIVDDVSESAARTLNLTENVKSPVKKADLAWGIGELLKAAESEGRPLSGKAVSKLLGLSQGYTQRLVTIVTKLKSNLFKRWRTSPLLMTVNDVYSVSQLPPEEQEAAFAALAGIEIGNTGADEGAGTPSSWVDSAKKKGAALGVVLGTLEREGVISTDGLDFDEQLTTLLKIPTKSKYNERKAVAGAIRRAYEKALATGEDNGEDE